MYIFGGMVTQIIHKHIVLHASVFIHDVHWDFLFSFRFSSIRPCARENSESCHTGIQNLSNNEVFPAQTAFNSNSGCIHLHFTIEPTTQESNDGLMMDL
jgi:hypothetical protein